MERSQLRWCEHLVRIPPGVVPGEVFWDQTQTVLERFTFLIWPGKISAGVGEVARQRVVCIPLLKVLFL